MTKTPVKFQKSQHKMAVGVTGHFDSYKRLKSD